MQPTFRESFYQHNPADNTVLRLPEEESYNNLAEFFLHEPLNVYYVEAIDLDEDQRAVIVYTNDDQRLLLKDKHLTPEQAIILMSMVLGQKSTADEFQAA